MSKPQNKNESLDHLSLDTVIKQTRKIIDVIQTARNSKLLVLISHRSLDSKVTLSISSALRKMDKAGSLDNLDVLLESRGGDINSAYKILQMLKAYAKHVTVVVPFYAKSAATLIALGADRLQMCKVGELGPVDPQVLDPNSSMMMPALSIKRAVDFINEISNPIVVASMADKISPMLIGAYRNAEAASKQYLNQIFMAKGFDEKERERLVSVFTKELLSHGYPMSVDFLKKHNIPMIELEEDQEHLFADLHEIWLKYCNNVYAANSKQARQMFILQNDMAVLINPRTIMITDTE